MEKNNATGNKCPLCRKILNKEKNPEKKMRNEIYKHPKVNDWMIKTYGKVI